MTRATSFALGLTLIAIACTGNDPDPVAGVSSSSGGSSSSGNTTSSSSGSVTSSSSSGSGPCVPGCKDDSTLVTCTATDQPCPLGCSTDGGAHCKRVYPAAPITAEMLAVDKTTDVSFPITGEKRVQANALNGSLSGDLRGPNAKPEADELEVINGIGFQRINPDGTHPLSIWMFKSFVVPVDQSVIFTSENPVVFVVQNDATLLGVIDVRGHTKTYGLLCDKDSVAGVIDRIIGGPGGGGGARGMYTAGSGKGMGGIPAANAGAGGGGFGANGQTGGAKTGGTPAGAPGGTAYGDATLATLEGGSGGGGSLAISGGGGGGAFRLVAGGKVIIGDGTHVGGINAGGCGGLSSTSATESAGAGGSGGAILLETPTLNILAKSGLAANGGNGGALNGGVVKGANAEIADKATPPALGVGAGGAGKEYVAASPPSVGATGNAGGGAVGRIRLNLRAPSFTPATGVILSPAPGGTPASATPTTIGTLDIH